MCITILLLHKVTKGSRDLEIEVSA